MSDEDADTVGCKRRREELEGDILTNEQIAERLDEYNSEYMEANTGEESTEGSGEGSPKRFRLDVADATTEEYESQGDEEEDEDEDDEEDGREREICPLCAHATSDLVRDLTALAERLAGRASQQHVTSMQLQIFENRVAPLRYEGRTDIPNITREWLHRHFTECRISPMRSVARDIRMFEDAEKLLRSNLADVDDEGAPVLSSRTASELCRLSKGKMDALKFFHQLSKERERKEANEKKS